MAESNSTRLGLRVWGAGSDTPSRSEFNTSFANLETLTAIDKQDITANRPAAGVRGTYFFDTTTEYLWRDTGAAWFNVGSRVQDAVAKSSVIGNVPMTLDTPAGQTANLLNLKVNGSIKASFDKDGNATVGTLTGVSGDLTNTVIGTVPLRITGASGQTADLLHVRANGPSDRFKVAADGTTTSPFGKWGASSTIGTDTATNVSAMSFWSGTPRTEIRMGGTGTFNEFVYLKNAAVAAGAATRRMGLVLKVGGEDATGAAQSAAMYLRSDAANFDAPTLYFDVRDSNLWKMDPTNGSETPKPVYSNGGHLRVTSASAGALRMDSTWVGTQNSGNAMYLRAGTTAAAFYFYGGGIHSDTNAAPGAGGVTYASLTPEGSSGRFTTGRMTLTDNSDVAAASSTPTLQIGSASSNNVIFDNDEILARNNGVVSTLKLQTLGGRVDIGNVDGTKVFIGGVRIHIGDEPTVKDLNMIWIYYTSYTNGGGIFRWTGTVWTPVTIPVSEL